MNTNKNISWKKSIKYLQILALIFIIALFWGGKYAISIYEKYDNKIQKLDQKIVEKNKIKENIKKLEEKNNQIENLYNNQKVFLNGYNNCYRDYSFKKYSIGSGTISSLKNCMKKQLENIKIESLKDVDLEKIAISFGVKKDSSKKLNFDQKTFLKSLDQNIFNDNLEEKVPLISFSNPVLINKNLNLYKVSFTFSTYLNYTTFKNIFNKLQNVIHKENYIYYTIKNISKFNLKDQAKQKNVNIQGNFYFER